MCGWLGGEGREGEWVVGREGEGGCVGKEEGGCVGKEEGGCVGGWVTEALRSVALLLCSCVAV